MVEELPSYELSPSSEEQSRSTEVIESYLVFREHWELIDKVFKIESPKEPTREDMMSLKAILFEYNRRKRNEIVIDMIWLVDDLFLDTLTSEELQRENALRKLCAAAVLEHPNSNQDELIALIKKVNEDFLSGEISTSEGGVFEYPF